MGDSLSHLDDLLVNPIIPHLLYNILGTHLLTKKLEKSS